jgi:putative endoribonuclease L-PSP
MEVFMKKEIISTDKAPAAIGPYVQATKLGEMLFTSGVIPVNPATGEIPSTVEEQARQAFSSLKALVEASGSSIEKVVKTTLFIKNMDDFAKINAIYAEIFAEPYPCRSCVEVARLPKDVLLEIEAVAHL